jgi:hypothetical protein
MLAQMETPQQLLDGMRYVSSINTTSRTFPSHGYMHPHLKVFVHMYGLLPQLVH